MVNPQSDHKYLATWSLDGDKTMIITVFHQCPTVLACEKEPPKYGVGDYIGSWCQKLIQYNKLKWVHVILLFFFWLAMPRRMSFTQKLHDK